MLLTTSDLNGGKLYRKYDPIRDEYKLSFRIPGNRIFLGWIFAKTVNKYTDIYQQRMIQKELQELDRKHPPSYSRDMKQKNKSKFVRDDFTR